LRRYVNDDPLKFVGLPGQKVAGLWKNVYLAGGTGCSSNRSLTVTSKLGRKSGVRPTLLIGPKREFTLSTCILSCQNKATF